MASYCFMSTEKIKSLGAFTRKMDHNFRLNNVPNADPDRKRLNKTLIDMNGESYVDVFKRKMIEAEHTPRKNAVLGIEVVMTYNAKDVEDDFDIEAWSKANVEWLQETFGSDNVISAELHRDEGPLNSNAKDGSNAAHIHAIVIPMKDNKLNAKHYLSGKAKLRDMQTSYGKAMEPFGLKRGLEGSKANHKDIRKWYDELNKTLAKELPKPEPDESVDKYYERASEYYTTSNLHHMKEKEVLERKLVEAKTMSSTISVDERIAIQERVKQLESEKEELEKEKKKIKQIKDEMSASTSEIESNMKKIKNFNLIVDGLRNYPDKEFAEQLSSDINRLIRWQSNIEKENMEVVKDNYLNKDYDIGEGDENHENGAKKKNR